jgi:hypothetical protein
VIIFGCFKELLIRFGAAQLTTMTVPAGEVQANLHERLLCLCAVSAGYGRELFDQGGIDRHAMGADISLECSGVAGCVPDHAGHMAFQTCKMHQLVQRVFLVLGFLPMAVFADYKCGDLFRLEKLLDSLVRIMAI